MSCSLLICVTGFGAAGCARNGQKTKQPATAANTRRPLPKKQDAPDAAELLALYGAVGWENYTRDPERLTRAVRTGDRLALRVGEGLVERLASGS